ncbi:hypothetical protein BDZ90DRAFT_193110 [Jaminaea rosea]|uniref:C3H1-type domain-containing protein n=1 Tax=Jaminaea rosea TaxID=1569628 RepID=A0A316USH7_9BASI|nr:hypothetical protein BDZ90DRAFT_193110 [Jaminaea rosea]PWN26833.1 hypothetical protein BDZ90DRAFT_193110 [Jaminaea rosea]
MSSSSYSPIPLDIRSPLSATLQTSIQHNLASRGYATEDDPVMAEYILVMLANSKAKEQIDAELSDLIGADTYEASFTEWLWSEAQRVLSGGEPGPSIPVGEAGPPQAEVSMDAAVDADTRSPPPAALRRSSRSPELQRRRSQSPPSRSRAGGWEGRNDDGGYGRGYRQDRGGPRDRDSRYGAPRPPRELFDSALGAAGTSGRERRAMREGRGQQGDEVGERRLAMDDEQLQAPHREVRIRGSAPTAPDAVPTGPRELFARSMNAAAQPPRGLRNNGRNGHQAPPNGSGLSLLARAGVPDPRAAAFVPTGPASAGSSMPNTLFSRIDPMLPNNAPPPSAESTQSSSALPTQPTQTSLCRWSLGCTAPTCAYSHPSPSAALARRRAGESTTATADDPVITSERPCFYGVGCTNKECGFSHVSPAVLFAQMKSSRNAAETAAAAVDTTATPCRFADKCSNASCGYAHFDAEGKPAPSPALARLLRPATQNDGQAAGMQQDESEGDVEINTEMVDGEAADGDMAMERGADGKPLALDRPLDGGASTPNGSSGGAKPCKFGSGCMRHDCWFSHPEWRKTTAQVDENGNADAGAGGGKLHISDRLSRFDRDGEMDGDAEVERIIPVA